MTQRGDNSSIETLHYLTAQSKRLHELRNGPKLGSEIDSNFTHEQKDIVGRLKPPLRSKGRPLGVPPCDTVYYLWGDERRAVRRFIDANSEYIDYCVNNTNHNGQNHLSHHWDEGLYELFREEYHFMKEKP